HHYPAVNLLITSPVPLILFSYSGHPLHPRSFPTRRSSDLQLLLFQVGPQRLAGGTLLADEVKQVVGNLERDAQEAAVPAQGIARSEEHTSELQSRENLVCRLLLEKKKQKQPGACVHHR